MPNDPFRLHAPTRDRWQDSAACASADPDLFHPAPGGGGALALAAAKRVCATCTVRSECLEDALRRDSSGVQGGMTRAERQAEKRRRRTAADDDAQEQEHAGELAA